MKADLERFLLFTVMVAGKPAARTHRLLEEFLAMSPLVNVAHITPFGHVAAMITIHGLEPNLRRLRCGQYRRIGTAFREIVEQDLNLETCTLEDLEAIHGIGPKSARYFLIRTRPTARYAALDTHILKWLRAHGVRDVPKTTPSSMTVYRRLEQRFLLECDKRGKTPGDFDYEIWAASTKHPIVDFRRDTTTVVAG